MQGKRFKTFRKKIVLNLLRLQNCGVVWSDEAKEKKKVMSGHHHRGAFVVVVKSDEILERRPKKERRSKTKINEADPIRRN